MATIILIFIFTPILNTFERLDAFSFPLLEVVACITLAHKRRLTFVRRFVHCVQAEIALLVHKLPCFCINPPSDLVPCCPSAGRDLCRHAFRYVAVQAGAPRPVSGRSSKASVSITKLWRPTLWVPLLILHHPTLHPAATVATKQPNLGVQEESDALFGCRHQQLDLPLC